MPSSAIFLGLILAIIGAFGEIALSNRKLLLGAGLLAFGFAWHYGARSTWTEYGEPGEAKTHVDWTGAIPCLLWTLVALLAGYVTMSGTVPW